MQSHRSYALNDSKLLYSSDNKSDLDYNQRCARESV